MSGFGYLDMALSHPLVREGRYAEVAEEYIQATALNPGDIALRRRALAFLGHMTRQYWDEGHFPPEGVACFWSFMQALPAYRGQAEALAVLDAGPRGPVLEAMAEAAGAIRARARQWAHRHARSHAEPRHLFLVTLPFSGVSAIAPILEDYLKAEGFIVVSDFARLPAALAEADAQGTRVFAWFHAPYELVEPYLQRPDIALAHLHRDPRDVVISCLGQDSPTPDMLFAGIFGYRLEELGIDSVPHYLALAKADPAAWATDFPTMKADVPATVRHLLGMLTLPVDEPRLHRLADAYSFQAMAGRKEGESPTFRRFGAFVVRNGTSGQWKQRYDRSCALFFAAKYGHLLLACGWADGLDWIEEVQG